MRCYFFRCITREKYTTNNTRKFCIYFQPRKRNSLALVNISTLAARQILSVFYRLLLAFIFHSIKVFFLLVLSLSPSHILPKREHVFDCVLNIMLHGNWRRTRYSTDTRQLVAQVPIKLQSDWKTSIEKKSSVRALSEWETEIVLHRQHQRPCQSTFRTREEIKRREKKILSW